MSAAASTAGDAATAAQKKWESENNVQVVQPDEIYKYDETKYEEFLRSKPWSKDPHYFKQVKISAVALLKLVMHAASGGKIEVMGVMQGKVEHETFVIFELSPFPSRPPKFE
jgi:COP9 signalosome complex subunit 5